jgi:glutamate dehydrogenase
MCYSKTILKEQILASDLPEDPFMKQVLSTAFPKPLQDRFITQMQDHPLRREIIATRLSNIINNEMGFTFVYRLQEEMGASVTAIVRAYFITRTALGLESIWKQIEDLGTTISAQNQIEMMMYYVRLSRRITRWFIRAQRRALDITETVTLYAEGIQELKQSIPSVLADANAKEYHLQYNDFLAQGIPDRLAHELTVTRGLFAAPDIIEIAHLKHIAIADVAQIYYGIEEYLDIYWIRHQIIVHTTENNWESLSREALRDDLDWQQRQLTSGVLGFDSKNKDLKHRFDSWGALHEELINRWRYMVNDLKSSSVLTYTMYFVAVRELLDLTQTTMEASQSEVI